VVGIPKKGRIHMNGIHKILIKPQAQQAKNKMWGGVLLSDKSWKRHMGIWKASKCFSCNFEKQRRGKSLRNSQTEETYLGFLSRAWNKKGYWYLDSYRNFYISNKEISGKVN